MKRYLLIAAVLFAAVFTIWLMVDHWQTSQLEAVQTEEAEEDRFVMGLSASGEAVSGDYPSIDTGEGSSPGADDGAQEKEVETLAASGDALGMTSLYQEVELPMADVLYQMEVDGFAIDKEVLEELSSRFEKELADHS